MAVTLSALRENGIKKVTQSVFSSLTVSNLSAIVGYLLTDVRCLKKQSSHVISFKNESSATVLNSVSVPRFGRPSNDVISSMASAAASASKYWFNGDEIVGQESQDITNYFTRFSGFTDNTTLTLKSATVVIISFSDTYFGNTPNRVLAVYASGKKFTTGMLPDVSHDGCTFAGWYTTATGGSKISTSTAIPSTSKTYYARWQVKVTYNFGAIRRGVNYGVWTSTSFVGAALTSVSRTGYLFYGWFDTTTGNQVTTVGTSNMSVLGKWAWNIDSHVTVGGTVKGVKGSHVAAYNGSSWVNLTNVGDNYWYGKIGNTDVVYLLSDSTGTNPLTQNVKSYKLSTGVLASSTTSLNVYTLGVWQIATNAMAWYQYKTETNADTSTAFVELWKASSGANAVYFLREGSSLRINGVVVGSSTTVTSDDVVASINAIVVKFTGTNFETSNETGTWEYGKINSSGYTKLGNFTREDEVEIIAT